MKARIMWTATLALASAGATHAETPLGTAFTYQGQLKSGGSPASGSFNMVFKLFDASGAGNQVGPTLTFDGAGGNPPPVAVASGLFTVQLDFGGTPYNGNKRWLEIAVSGTALAPRQELTAAPNALFALNAAAATNATQLNGQSASFYLNASNISQGVVPSAFGGTGLNTSAASTGSLLYTSGVGSWSVLPPGSNSQVLTLSGGVPTWSNAVGLNLPYSGSASAGFPDAAFKVTNSGTGYALAAQTGTGAFGFAHTDGGRTMASYVDSTDGWFGMRSNHPLKLMTNSTVVMVLNGSHVGIGTTTPTNNLSVAGIADFASSVGIGTTTPTTLLDVRGSLTLDAGGSPGLFTGTGSVELNRYLLLINSSQLQSASGLKAGGLLVSDDYFYANPGKTDLIVKGRIGVGTAAPSQALHVVGSICATNSIGACSDARFKEHVVPMAGAMSIVEKLRPVHFDWKRDEFPKQQFSADRQVGLIAQEVQKVVPEVVQKGSDGYLSVDYGRLTPILIAAVKQQQQTIQDLRKQSDRQLAEKDEQIARQQERIAALEARFDRLEKSLAGLTSSKRLDDETLIAGDMK